MSITKIVLQNFLCQSKNKSPVMKDEVQEILKELSDADAAKLHSYTQQKNFTKGTVYLLEQ